MTSEKDEMRPGTNPTAEPSRDCRSQRIDDYCTAALQNGSPLLANVGCEQRSAARPGLCPDGPEPCHGGGWPSLAGLATVTPGIEMLLKVNKQIDRFAQLEIRLAKDDRQASGLGEAGPGKIDQITPGE